MRWWSATLTLLVAATTVPGFAGASEQVELARRAVRLLDQWRVAEAAALLKTAPQGARGPEIEFARGRLAFFRGDYARAEKLLRAAVGQRAKGAGGKDSVNPRWLYTAALVSSTRAATAGYQEFRTADGRIVVRYEPGKDAVLVPLVIEGLRGAIREIGADLGFHPAEPVLVEIYPSAQVLAKVSPLTEKDIETSGTIALCKYNRLMFTSPRALLQGYAWLDSLAHEFVHYAVTKVSHNSVPIWLHEGIAKWEETRWRGTSQRRLGPNAEHLLAEALAKNKLITFAQMHPSMAKLPSQEAAGLAFAEVYTVIAYLHQRVGLAGLRRVLRLMSEGRSDAQAIAAVTKVGFGRFKKDWMRYLRGLRLHKHPGHVLRRLRFKKRKKRKRNDLRDIALKKARDFTHLGELLRHRGHLRAAVVEYRKAMKLAKDRFPVIQNRMAKALLRLRRGKEVVEALEPTLRWYPGYATTHLHLGEAYMLLGKVDKAIAALEESERINPFNPRVQEALARLYRRRGDEAHARRAARNWRVLRGESGDDPWAPQRTLGG